MPQMVVSVFNSRHDAEAARERLLARGFDNASIRVVGEIDPSPALAGAMERVLSGLVLNDDETAQYAHAVRYGKSVVALHVPDDATAAKAVSVLDEVGGEIGEPAVSERPASTEKPPAGAAEASYGGPRAFEPPATLPRPRVYPLPNSPTGWGEATRGERSALDTRSDPARPEGLTEDAHGLGTDNTRRATERQARKRGKNRPRK